MKKEEVRTKNARSIPSIPLSQALKFGNLVFTSGSVAINPATGNIVAGGIKAQVEQVLKNLEEILNEANTSLRNALKVNAYLANKEDFAAFNEVYKNFIDLDTPPARTTLTVGPFPLTDLLIEIDVIAYIPD